METSSPPKLKPKCCVVGCMEPSMKVSAMNIVARDGNDLNNLVALGCDSDFLLSKNGVAMLCLRHYRIFHKNLYNRDSTCNYYDINTATHCYRPVDRSAATAWTPLYRNFVDVVDARKSEASSLVYFCPEHTGFVMEKAGKSPSMLTNVAKQVATPILINSAFQGAKYALSGGDHKEETSVKDDE